MAWWDIYPPGVEGALKSTAAVANDFEGHAKAYVSNLATAQKGCQAATGCTAASSGGNGLTGVVAKALGEFYKSHEQTLPKIVGRANAAMKGAADSTMAYAKGAEEQAQNAQENANQAPRPIFFGAPKTGGSNVR
jgi:hypothetical protein